MDTKENGRGGLEGGPFTFREGGDRVFISWRGRQVTVLKGADAKSFLRRVIGQPEIEQQQVMARVTGNFKRGNER